MKENNSKHKKNILMTGGHAATTALAIVEEIKTRSLPWNISWVGSDIAMEGLKVPTLESTIFPEIGVKTYSIHSGRLQKRYTSNTIPSLLKIPKGFLEAKKLLSEIKPDLILSFGGYAAFPIVFVGWLMGITVVVHEQVATAGRSNQLSSHFARKIILSRETSKKYYPKGEVLGNPVNKRIVNLKNSIKRSNPLTIYITGGSRGSQIVNEVIEKLLTKLLLKYKILHQVGHLEYEKYKKVKTNLPDGLGKNYEVFSQISPLEIHKFYEKSDLVISRAGANTVSELIVSKKPSILIPISWSHKNEQYENAVFAKDFGIATILDQEKLTPEILEKEIHKSAANLNSIRERVSKKVSPDLDASSKIVDSLERMLK